MSDRLQSFNNFLGSVDRTIGALGQVAERRRTIAFTNLATDARRRINTFQNELRQNPNWDQYDLEWQRRRDEIQKELSERIKDPVLQEQFTQWYAEETLRAGQQVEKLAWDREVASGIASLEYDLEAAREMNSFEERAEHINFVTQQAVNSGYVDEPTAARYRRRELERLELDQSIAAATDIYEQTGGDYGAAIDWALGTDSGVPRGMQAEVITHLNRLDAARKRQAEQLRQERLNTHFVAAFRGGGSISAILDDSALEVTDKNFLIDLYREQSETEQQVGEGSTTDTGARALAGLRAQIDTGKITPLELYSQAARLYADGEITRTERDQIIARRPLEELRPLWESFDAALQDAVDAGEEITEQEKNRYRRQLEQKAQRFFTTGADGELVPRQNYSENEIIRLAENYVREDIMGERIIERVHRRDFGFGDDPSGIAFWRGDLNPAETNLRAIDEGRLIGQTHREEYTSILEDMSYEHKAMLQALPSLESMQWAGFDRDGRPVFVANTPAGRRAVALFTIDPVTKEEYVDEQPYIWDPDRELWSPLPEGSPANSARADSTAGGVTSSTAVQGIMPE